MNPKIFKSWAWVTLAMVLPPSNPLGVAASPGQETPVAEVVKRGKEATAFLEFGPGQTATAFCVHPSGYFITNDHVVHGRMPRPAGELKLVMNSGTREQKVYSAKVIRSDRKLDLALLRVEAGADLPALPLGRSDDLVELADVIVFGFPFGRGPGVPAGAGADQYPAISLNRGAISSLKRKDGQIERVQLNASVNPGNSGGPLLNLKGQVLGVILGRVEGRVGAGIDLAIPINHLESFLFQPSIHLTVRGGLDSIKEEEPVEFQAEVMTILSDQPPLDVELILADGTPRERRLAMTRSGSTYLAKAVAFPKPAGQSNVVVEIQFPDGSVRGTVKDQTLGGGATGVRLSRLQSVAISPSRAAVRDDGQPLEPPPELPQRLPVVIGRQTLDLELSNATALRVLEVENIGAMSCAVVALRGTNEVGRLGETLYLKDAPRPGFEALRQGRFFRPIRSSTPISYLRVESQQGDFIGQGNRFDYSRDDLNFQGSGLQVLRCQVGNTGNWTILFSAGQGRSLDVGEYRNAKRQPFAGDAPGIEFTGNGRGCNMISGEFRIWELEFKDEIRVAIDFVQRCEEKGPPLVGMLRFNSSYH
jgi:hypothetical protein